MCLVIVNKMKKKKGTSFQIQVFKARKIVLTFFSTNLYIT